MEALIIAEGVKKLYSSLKKPTLPEPEPTSPIRCKMIAFHHAGYDPETTPNTVMFRLKGTAQYGGGVCTNIVEMILRSTLR